MDLEVFEQKVSSSGIFRAPVASELATAEEIPAEESENGAVCSVFMGKSSNARVHQLFAELTGMSQQDASRACQKAIVAIAKDVSESDAHNIKAQFAAINVQVRITKRK
jgi:ribosomal protein L7/L12